MALLRRYTASFERRPYLTLLVTNGVLMSLGDFSAQTLVPSLTGTASLSPIPIPYDFERTARYAIFGSSMGPLAGAWNKFLEVNFPLRSPTRVPPSPMTKVKVEPNDFPIPGLREHLPKGSRLERGGSRSGGSFGGSEKSTGEKEETKEKEKEKEGVSVLQLVKRVAADQLGMAPISLFIFLFSMSLLEGLDSEQTVKKFRENYLPILMVNWQIWPLFQLFNFRYVPLRYRVPVGSLAGIAWTCFLSYKTSKGDVDLEKLLTE